MVRESSPLAPFFLSFSLSLPLFLLALFLYTRALSSVSVLHFSFCISDFMLCALVRRFSRHPIPCSLFCFSFHLGRVSTSPAVSSFQYWSARTIPFFFLSLYMSRRILDNQVLLENLVSTVNCLLVFLTFFH